MNWSKLKKIMKRSRLKMQVKKSNIKKIKAFEWSYKNNHHEKAWGIPSSESYIYLWKKFYMFFLGYYFLALGKCFNFFIAWTRMLTQ